ncbi:lyase family protein [Pleionea sp. CnH1-48]|uniref:class II fumarate hydratase n=1 Tax=Pleionea sp. CnH1-48 TaxID=2954494 RepID=UPI002096D504|nr:class II fumarate hydratase [Pleionea sp. CnH1-48]MCO7222914.1 class II fumarate hydratase [Pleionea sp. CnH1-48]
MTKVRIERDSMGELAIPEDALYGPQTQRAINNFPVSGQSMPVAFIKALLSIKSAAARANVKSQQLESAMGAAIEAACRQLIKDEQLLQHFPVDVFQTGSGTSSNMNANEVIARLASGQYGGAVSPNDHVNCGQSSNDVIPTAIHVSAAIMLAEQLLPAMYHLADVIDTKAENVHHHVKTGRTHLMDAMPVRMSQSLSAWSQQIRFNIEQLKALQPSLQSLAQGGTAVGTGINAAPGFSNQFCQELTLLTNIQFKPAANLFTSISTQDTAVALSGQLKTTAVSIMKIANDLRWMNSGPLAGLGEIELEALQPGSSIMPGKVNPVIPESAAMVAAQVMGNDTAITVAGQAGNFELNVMLPLIANNLLNSMTLLSNTARLLADKAIATFQVNEANLKRSLDRNPILVTALNPVIGYLKAAEIAKTAYKEQRPIIEVAEAMTDLTRGELEQILAPTKLADGGHD